MAGDFSWEDLFGGWDDASALAGNTDFSPGDMLGALAGRSDSPEVLSFWGGEQPTIDYGSVSDFGGGPEVRGNWDYDYSSAGVGQEPSLWQQANDWYALIEKAASSPLGKFGIGGLGALVSVYGANKQNKYNKQAMQDALAAKAAQRAQFASDTAPMRVTNQRRAVPSWGAGNRNAFSGNSLAAMTPRSTNTMYAAEGGEVSGQGGLCQACAARQNYVEGGTAGQDDKIPAMLSDGEYIVDADVVSALGDGNNAAGAKKLDKMRVGIRTHKRSASPNKIPPKAKKPEAYLKGAK